VKILIDMCLSPSWVPVLERHGFSAVHWSAVGDGRAPDAVVLKWAHDNGHLVFTNDMDFGAILAATRATAPSVIQVRTQDVTPEHLTALVVHALRQHEAILQQGALITVDEARLRSRILPLVP
jgi:predicted nuclease of predicted toxin-antitoxin system